MSMHLTTLLKWSLQIIAPVVGEIYKNRHHPQMCIRQFFLPLENHLEIFF